MFLSFFVIQFIKNKTGLFIQAIQNLKLQPTIKTISLNDLLKIQKMRINNNGENSYNKKNDNEKLHK